MDKNDFYQSKYECYRTMGTCVVISAVLVHLICWLTDCQLYNRVAYETLPARLIVLIPLTIYFIASRRIRDYKIMIPFSYFSLLSVTFATIWINYLIPDKSHASEGFLLMQFMYITFGFCAPKKWSIIAHLIMVTSMAYSHTFVHYNAFDTMMTFGISIGVAIQLTLWFVENDYKKRYKLDMQIKDMMIHDQLTKAYNRNKLAELCYKGTNKFAIGKVGILILDIDYFKKVNDTYGHTAGDRALVSLVDIINDCIQDNGYIVRWGGEEFIVLLPGYSNVASREIAEKIRKSVEAFDKEQFKFTVSIGVTTCDGDDYTDSIKNADKALYYAKEHGRNQTSVYVKEWQYQ